MEGTLVVVSGDSVYCHKYSGSHVAWAMVSVIPNNTVLHMYTSVMMHTWYCGPVISSLMDNVKYRSFDDGRTSIPTTND